MKGEAYQSLRFQLILVSFVGIEKWLALISSLLTGGGRLVMKSREQIFQAGKNV